MVIADENLISKRKGVLEGSNLNRNIDIPSLKEKKVILKSTLKRIEINQLPTKLPDFENAEETKDNVLAEWLAQWIEISLKENKLQKNDLLPRKADLASYFGVSVGTVQTAIRFIEDKGYVESKQRIGTFIRDITKLTSELRKQTSKRDQAILAIKKVIIKNSYGISDSLPSSRELAKIIGSAPNTTRLALEYLSSVGIIETRGCRGNKANWILKAKPVISNDENLISSVNLESDTLVDQVERDLKCLIASDYKVGDKLLSHFELADTLKVSIKTVHDAMRRLVDQNILKSKRGRYGTFILRMPSDSQLYEERQENSIFASAVDASLYNYEKVEHHLKSLIKENYKTGEKLPAMGKLAVELKVSSNTVRKALQRLSNENIVKFSRGRYGGTFVLNIPEVEAASFTWLSVNPAHIAAYHVNK